MNAFIFLLSWTFSGHVPAPLYPNYQTLTNDYPTSCSALTIDSEAEVILQIKALGLSPMWYSAQYEAHLKGTSVLRAPSLDAQAQNGMSQTPDEYVLNHQLVFSPHYRGFVYTPASGWYHFQSKLRIRKASNLSNLAQQVPVGTDTPVFVAGGAVVIQESPSTARYKEYNVHIFKGASRQYDWYEVDSLSMASANATNGSEAAPTRWRFKAQATSGGFRVTTLTENVQASSTKRFAYHIHGLDRRPDSITANGKNIVYIYLPETQSVIFKLSAGEHHLLVDYP